MLFLNIIFLTLSRENNFHHAEYSSAYEKGLCFSLNLKIQKEKQLYNMFLPLSTWKPQHPVFVPPDRQGQNMLFKYIAIPTSKVYSPNHPHNTKGKQRTAPIFLLFHTRIVHRYTHLCVRVSVSLSAWLNFQHHVNWSLSRSIFVHSTLGVLHWMPYIFFCRQNHPDVGRFQYIMP